MADEEQIARIRSKLYSLASSGGPNADQARRMLSKLPKMSVGHDYRAESGDRAATIPVHGELAGGDVGSELPPTADEMAGIENKPAELPVTARAAMTALVPSNRREFFRGADDVLTFGAGQKVAGKIGRALGDAPDVDLGATQAEDARSSPNARSVGRLAGALSGRGLTGAVGRGSLKIASPISNAGKGLLGKATSGAIGGAVANEVAMPVIAGGQAAFGGPQGEEGFKDYASRVGETMKREALNPTNAIAGFLLGGASGTARGIRDTGQTGRDIRLVEGYGATPSRIGRGPQGGVFDSPLMRDIEGSAHDQGSASRVAAEHVMNSLDEASSALSRQYGADKAAARSQGFLEGRIDTNALREDAQQLIAGQRLTSAQRSAIQREVLDELDKFPSGMTVDDFNDMRGKLGDVFGIGPSEAAHPALDTLRQSAKRTIDETEMGPINEAYSKGRERIARQHEQLGTVEGGRRGVQERRIANIIQRRANDESPGAGIQDASDLGTEQFLKENERHRPMFDTARLLAAKERMTAGIEPQGGFFRRVGKHGLMEKNLEPALVGAYRLGLPMEKGSIPAALAAQFLLNGGPQ